MLVDSQEIENRLEEQQHQAIPEEDGAFPGVEKSKNPASAGRFPVVKNPSLLKYSHHVGEISSVRLYVRKKIPFVSNSIPMILPNLIVDSLILYVSPSPLSVTEIFQCHIPIIPLSRRQILNSHDIL